MTYLKAATLFLYWRLYFSVDLPIRVTVGDTLSEGGSGPVARTVFKTDGRSDELRWWVRLPSALVQQQALITFPIDNSEDSPQSGRSA